MSARKIPKVLADFGEKQFRETSPDAVEVLRVKASTIRKYWSKLKGVTFIVAVVRSDGVRVYLFNVNAVMLVGENISREQYTKVRSKSKLLRKFERPTPPTELELRMEATEEVRTAIAKALKRVARFLTEKEPRFPTIYVSKNVESQSSQLFDMTIEPDGAFIFREDALKSENLEPLALRTAFLCHLETDKARLEFSQCIANAVVFYLLKGKSRDVWDKDWAKRSKDSHWDSMGLHLVHHRDTYGQVGISRVLQVIRDAPVDCTAAQWYDSMRILHQYHEVSLGTESWHTIQGFYKDLGKPRKLLSNRHKLDMIHLQPRVLCNVVPLGIELKMHIAETHSLASEWLSVGYHEGARRLSFMVGTDEGETIETIHYYLQLADVVPKTGGIISGGKSVIQWALNKLGQSTAGNYEFRSTIALKNLSLNNGDRAVLERLSLGRSQILFDTLVGSPHRIESLVKSNCVSIVPSFNHIGIEPNLLVRGDASTILDRVIPHVLEATVFEGDVNSFALVSAPSIWNSHLYKAIHGTEVSIWTVCEVNSPRRLVRFEEPFHIDN